MALHEISNRQYYNVSLGKIRQKVSPGTPGAVERMTEKGQTLTELVYNGIDGILENIIFKQHPDFGNSWTIYLNDSGKNYGIKFSEKSRAGIDLLKKIPNLKKGQHYSFTPYDFESDGRRKSGLSIKTMSGVKVESYYQVFSEKNGKTTVENLYNFPTPDFDYKKASKEDWQVYFIKVTKFLREKTLAFLESEFKKSEFEDLKNEPDSVFDNAMPVFEEDEDDVRLREIFG